MLGDYVRGRRALKKFPFSVRLGIELHRHVDAHLDQIDQISELRESFSRPFRRYSGIIIDLAYDHELARRWPEYSAVTLEAFDRDVRILLAENEEFVPDGLRRFMSYADRRGLFAAYRNEEEILHSLRGLGSRLRRPNPLHRVSEIWDEMRPLFAASFAPVLAQVQSDVADWLNRKSTTTGS